jgi:D-serine deaminase-like pyridoxal phosphate-dependent protein
MPGDHWGRDRHLRFRDGERGLHDYTELQCGSYIFMVAHHGRNLDRDGAPTKAFEPSPFMWATVMIRPAQDRAIVDADVKALAFDFRPVARSRRDRHRL